MILSTLIRIVLVLIAAALFGVPVPGNLDPEPPSLEEQRSFATMVENTSGSFTTTATLEQVQLVRKNMNPMPSSPFRRIFQEPVYEYAARYRFSGTDTRFVLLLPVDMKAEDLEYYDPEVDEELLPVVNAYAQVSSAPLVSFVDTEDDPPPGLKPDDIVWQLYEFDPKAVDGYLAGRGYRFLQSTDGSVTLIP